MKVFDSSEFCILSSEQRLKALIEATFDMNGKTLPPNWRRQTPFCEDRVEAVRRYDMVAQAWRDAA